MIGEDHARPGVEALGGAEGQLGAAEHALQAAHEVVVAHQAEVAGLLEAEAHLVADRGCPSGLSGLGNKLCRVKDHRP